MNNQKPSWLWVIILTPLLSVIQLLVFAWRFGRIEEMLTESTVFLPAGLIAALGLVYWLRASRSAKQKRNTVIGYLVGIPFAFLGSLFLPLTASPWIGATIGGALPWLLTTWIGYRLGNGSQPSK